jgi:hypothetical protein
MGSFTCPGVNRPMKNAGLNGKWKMVKVFSMFHLPFAMQDAFFSILLK